MNRSTQIALALLVDTLAGDPRWLPHPAKLTGGFAQRLELFMRSRIADEKLAGTVTAGVVIGSSALAATAVTSLAKRVHPVVGDLASILILWTTVAARDLAGHAFDVHGALESENLPEARRLVARMVGRDVDVLDEAGIVRAVVESVGENTVDGVTAPLFYAYLGGPVAAAAYKAVSTLDSTFGYRNERYIRFGWASARSDDVADLIPARLTVVANFLAAAIAGLRPTDMLRISIRDGGKHASPNSGIAEAAMAGALGVQLGGPLMRDGQMIDYPTLGDPQRALGRDHIKQAVVFMAATTAVWAGLLTLGGALLKRRRSVSS